MLSRLRVVPLFGLCIFCPIHGEVILAEPPNLIIEAINGDSEEEQLAAISTLVEMQRQIRSSSKRLYEIACDKRRSDKVRIAAIEAIGALTIPFALDQSRVGGYSESWVKQFVIASDPLAEEESSIEIIIRNPVESVELRVAAMEILAQSAMKHEHIAIPAIIASVLRDETAPEDLRMKSAEYLSVRTPEPGLACEALSHVLSNNKTSAPLRKRCVDSLVALAMSNGSDQESVKASVSALERVSLVARNPNESNILRKAALDQLFLALNFPGTVRDPARVKCLDAIQPWTKQLMNDAKEDQELRDVARSLHRIAE